MNPFYKLGIIFLLSAFSAAEAADRIGKIKFVGNEDTQESTIMRQMYIHEGDLVDYDKIARSVQSIMDLALFTHSTYALDYQENDGVDDIYQLTIFVEEKYYLLLIPRVKYRDNQLRTGIQLRADNLYGLNHKLRYLYERKGKYQGQQEIRQRLSYKYPQIMGTDHTLSIRMVSENTVSEQDNLTFLNNQDDTFGIGMRFWLDDQHNYHGPYLDVGFSINNRDQKTIGTNTIVNSASSNTIGFELGNKRSHVHQFNRSGMDYGYSLNVASSVFGSDSTYFKHVLFYRNYITFDSRPNENLNIQTILGHATSDVLGDKAFILDFRNDLRGYARGRFQGNAMYLVNIEYMTPSSYSPNLRYLGFIDAGTTSDSIETLSEETLHLGVGVGIRWKVPAFVNLDIRIDIGYGVSDENVQATFGTRNAF